MGNPKVYVTECLPRMKTASSDFGNVYQVTLNIRTANMFMPIYANIQLRGPYSKSK